MIRMPLLSTSNCFSVLAVDTLTEIDDLVEKIQAVQTPETTTTNKPAPNSERISRPKWERQIPARLVIHSLEDKNNNRSLKLKVSIETTNTGEIKSLNALIDSRATGKFIDQEYIKSNQMTTKTLSGPIPVYNVDGMLNEAGSITEVVDLILRYKNHSERTLFCVTGLGKQNILLGHTWLQTHNPEILG